MSKNHQYKADDPDHRHCSCECHRRSPLPDFSYTTCRRWQPDDEGMCGGCGHGAGAHIRDLTHTLEVSREAYVNALQREEMQKAKRDTLRDLLETALTEHQHTEDCCDGAGGSASLVCWTVRARKAIGND